MIMVENSRLQKALVLRDGQLVGIPISFPFQEFPNIWENYKIPKEFTFPFPLISMGILAFPWDSKNPENSKISNRKE